MNRNRMPFANHVRRMLGVPSKLPKDFAGEFSADLAENEGQPQRVIHFRILTAADADVMSMHLNHSPIKTRVGRGRPRIFAECDHCGAWISAGRFNQHHSFHAAGGAQ